MASDAERLRTYEADFREAGLAIFVLLSFPTRELWQMFTNATHLKLRENLASG